jgi:hypothetical protein
MRYIWREVVPQRIDGRQVVAAGECDADPLRRLYLILDAPLSEPDFNVDDEEIAVPISTAAGDDLCRSITARPE